MGKKKKQTVGYKYFLGMLMVLGEKVEYVLKIKHGEKLGWQGTSRGGRISYNKSKLFGKNMGGVSASIDFEKGLPGQPQNDYMAGWRGQFTSANRGVATLVWRKPYLGNNPFLQKISVLCGNVHEHFDDWYPEKAEIASTTDTEDVSIFLALDVSISMNGTRQVNQKIAVVGFINSLRGRENSIRIVGFAANVVYQIERFNCGDPEYDDLVAFVNAIPDNGGIFGTSFANAVPSAAQFYADADGGTLQATLFSLNSNPNIDRRRVLILTTDGEVSLSDANAAQATLSQISDIEVFAINIDNPNTTFTQIIDNTPGDSVPVISGSDPNALRVAISAAFTSWIDMNPAHMIRQWLINPAWRGNGDPNAFDATFTQAADTLYNEGFGLSFRFKDLGDRKKAITEIERHIDAYTYKDRLTGKWGIELVRPNYDVNTLPVFDASNITGWDDPPKRLMPTELPNSLTLEYTRREDGKPGSLSLANSALLSATGVLNPSKASYKGINDPNLASKVLVRELEAGSTPLFAGTFLTAFIDPALHRGSPIIVNEPRLGLNNVVGRITALRNPSVLSDSGSIAFLQDEGFDLGAAELTGDTTIIEGSLKALPSDHRVVEEVPYYMLVLDDDQASIDSQLAAHNGLGFLHASGNRPSNIHINESVLVDNGSGFNDVGVSDFSPTVLLINDIDRAATTILVNNSFDLDDVRIGTLFNLEGEYCRIDDMQLVGSDVSLTVGRGCIDTVPVKHSAGAAVVFSQDFADNVGIEYLSGQSVSVKLVNRTGRLELPINSAPTDIVVFNSRAIRPYPVGNFQIDGSYSDFQLGGMLTMTWAHRDRIFQTTVSIEDHTFGNIGPEPGVDYQVQIQAQDLNGADLGLVVDVSVGQLLTYNFDPSAASLPAGTTRLVFRVVTTRAGFENWQSPEITGYTLVAPSGLSAIETIVAPTNFAGVII